MVSGVHHQKNCRPYDVAPKALERLKNDVEGGCQRLTCHQTPYSQCMA